MTNHRVNTRKVKRQLPSSLFEMAETWLSR